MTPFVRSPNRLVFCCVASFLLDFSGVCFSVCPIHTAGNWSLFAGWPHCTETGRWQCNLHYSHSSLHKAVISMPGKLMSLRCRSRLGMAAACLRGRGSRGGKWRLWLTAARQRWALLGTDRCCFQGFCNLKSVLSAQYWKVLYIVSLSCSFYWSPC